ncbi:MAG: hypothetical protein NTX44_07635 [Ignavibacteriales bacterium]|nr:hypothetical protein [Ignavibacteriales bacterium]
MTTKYFILVCAFIGISVLISGCSAGGAFMASNVTDVQLQKSNFKIVARNISGEAQAGYLIGGTFSMGMVSNTFALVRVSGSGMLYKEALENLWKSYETAYGPVEGKRLALINVRYDSDALNLIVYTQPKITIRADIVEFTD